MYILACRLKTRHHTLGITVEEVIEEEGEEEDDEDMSVEDEEGGEGGEFEGIDDDEFEAGKSTPPLSKIHLSEVSPGLIYSSFHCSSLDVFKLLKSNPWRNLS